MNYCTQEGCTGHLGKFPSCLAEALWEISTDGGGESTGSTEAYGHFTLIHIDCTSQYVLGYDPSIPDADQTGPTLVIKEGWYIVQAYDSGRVDYEEYDSEAEARVDFDQADDEYGSWLNINEPDEYDDDEDSDIPPNAGSSE